ncbi:MAG: cytochrome c peroxidase [Campylobacterota bacterium]|nr:cytochrome c peroxidase [Campylobacterota bacterium]
MFKIIYTVVFINLFTINSIAEVITPIPLEIKYNKEKALLGKKLFSDTTLSKDDTISCASCHILQDGGDDNMQYSFGIKGQMGVVNSPTVFNAVFNFAQMRDGAAANLKEQVHLPLTNPIEMGATYKDVIKKLKNNKEYKEVFNTLYKDGINQNNINDALAQFQTALITPNSRFDRYLRGDKDAITKDELEGFKLFKKNGCTSCHNGVNIGGNLYQKVGIIETYIHDEKDISHELGRYNVTKKEYHKYLNKVPTLRNIELTAPYLHNGSQKTLKQTVVFMLTYQVGIEQSDENIDKIVKFLNTLTGEFPSIVKENYENK